MSDWLGMSGRPRVPRPELRAAVLARAVSARRRLRWQRPLAVAASVVILAGGAMWIGRTVRWLETLAAERAELAARVAALEDTLSLVRSPGTRVIQIPVTTGGRPGAITIFADSATHRWLVACHNLAPNEPDQAYQLWFITETGTRSASVMPMESDAPMIMTLEMPEGAGQVMGAAMSIEPRAGSPAPRGPVLFRVQL